ncbi:hypothetical protein [Paracoccus aminovorans]|uniref:hypothetical protein n=1 Tax=Paracoccus aminovorans TaxID=34004 RepID=UPI000AC03FC2|nr:hypothetical protein [Paracoccus aminovorans]MDQ7775702.1 hypothetical protein [Paracoccus aminovorans]
MRSAAAVAALLALTPPVLADDLADFLATEGCAIGPATAARAEAAGLDRAVVDALGDRWRDDPETVLTGDWLVLPPAACTIKPPVVESALKLTDPDVRAAFSAVDAHANDGSPGCFLDQDRLLDTTAAARGWTRDQATVEYLRLVGQSMASGAMTLYADSPLRTPYGSHLMTGSCGEALPYRDDARRAHDHLVQNFDRIVRRNLREVPCEYGSTWPSTTERERMHNDLRGTSHHAWLWFEAFMIVYPSDWYEGVAATEKGAPRPPLCHYADAAN